MSISENIVFRFDVGYNNGQLQSEIHTMRREDILYNRVHCCAALRCDLACFFLPSFSSLIKTCIVIMIQYVHLQNVHEQLYDSSHYCFPITITL